MFLIASTKSDFQHLEWKRFLIFQSQLNGGKKGVLKDLFLQNNTKNFPF